MNAYTRTSVLMSTLALVSAGLIPTAASGQEGVGSPEVVAAQNNGQACSLHGASATIDVDGVTMTLQDAIAEATTRLAPCTRGGWSVELRLTGEGPYQFPDEVNAEGSIRIVSALADGKFPVIQQHSRNPVVLRSSLHMKGVHWIGNYRGFVAHDHFTLEHSKVEYGGQGRDGDRERHLVIAERTHPSSNPNQEASVVTIQNSTFINMGVVVAQEVARVEVSHNTVQLDGQGFAAVVLLDHGGGDSRSEIVGNSISAVNHKFMTVLGINDGYVSVSKNTFNVAFVPNLPTAIPHASILLINDGHLLNGFETIGIVNNVFLGGPAVDWIASPDAPRSPAGSVAVGYNDFSQSAGAFASPKTPDQEAALSASCNFWGQVDRSKANAPGVDQVLDSADFMNASCGPAPVPQDPGAQPPAGQDPNGRTPGTQDPNVQDPNAQDPNAQDPNAQQPGGPANPPPPVVDPAPVVPPVAPAPVPAPVPSPAPTEDPVIPKEIKEDAKEEVSIDQSGLRLAGLTRFETAVEAAQHQFPKQHLEDKESTHHQTVILARGDVAADSVAAVPLAKALQAPILLTPPDHAHPSTIDEIRRLVKGSGEVILMGGEDAIHRSVELTIKHLGVAVGRIQGENRAATAVQTAKRLESMGKLHSVYLVDGQDWQPALITGPVAAKTDGATLLTNGTELAPESREFLAQHASLTVTAIGDKAAATGLAKETHVGRDGTELSLKVAREYFDAADRIGVATSVDFADALIGGGHIGQQGGALVLTNGRNASRINAYLKSQPTITKLYVYGGAERVGVASEIKH